MGNRTSPWPEFILPRNTAAGCLRLPSTNSSDGSHKHRESCLFVCPTHSTHKDKSSVPQKRERRENEQLLPSSDVDPRGEAGHTGMAVVVVETPTMDVVQRRQRQHSRHHSSSCSP